MHDLSLAAAFLTGLMGSAHCFAMCGGIASALGMHARAGSSAVKTTTVASLYQLGRVCGYALAGVIVGFAGSQLARLLDMAQLANVLRIASAVLILLMGLRLLVRWNALQWIELLGARFWMTLRPLVRLAGSRPGIAKPLVLGLLWSLLPCGLIYSILMLAALSADPAHGALIMLAFGLGTLPSMLATSLLAARLQSYAAQPVARIASGLLLLVLGIWMMVASLSHGHHTRAPHDAKALEQPSAPSSSNPESHRPGSHDHH